MFSKCILLKLELESLLYQNRNNKKQLGFQIFLRDISGILVQKMHGPRVF